MPEVGEVAHAVANLKRNIIGRTIKTASFLHDDKIFSGLKNVSPPATKKAKTTSLYFYQPELKFSDPVEIERCLIDKQVVDVGRHGKYFWIRTEGKPRDNVSSSGTLILMHFGMTGWLKFKDIYSHFIQMEGGGYKKVFKLLGADENGQEVENKEDFGKIKGKDTNDSLEDRDTVSSDDWPPRFHKFLLTLDDKEINKSVDVGFVDPRRLSKVRFYEITPKLKTDELLLENIEQLSKLGPDYSKKPSNANIKTESDRKEQFVHGDADPDDHGRSILPLSEFLELFHSKPKLTIKPFLLKQEVFAGIGNWMADEILFQSAIYPEETLGALTDQDIETLYNKLIEVSKVAVELEADVTKFPKNWLMLYRWGKKSKKTFEGHDVKFVTVGGRTSCYVAEIQKKRPKRVVKVTEESTVSKKGKSTKTKTTTRKVTTRINTAS